MKKLMLVLAGVLFITVSSFGTNVKVLGRATSVVIDGSVVTITCDGFYQSETCYEMEIGVSDVVVKDGHSNVIATGNGLVSHTKTEYEGIETHVITLE